MVCFLHVNALGKGAGKAQGESHRSTVGRLWPFLGVLEAFSAPGKVYPAISDFLCALVIGQYFCRHSAITQQIPQFLGFFPTFENKAVCFQKQNMIFKGVGLF